MKAVKFKLLPLPAPQKVYPRRYGFDFAFISQLASFIRVLSVHKNVTASVSTILHGKAVHNSTCGSSHMLILILIMLL